MAKKLWKKGKVPIVVGGSTFYILSLFFPPEVQSDSKGFYEKEKVESNLWDRLYSVDPERAKKIHKNDSYRVARALNIWLSSGKKPSKFQPEYCPPAPYLFLNLERKRQDLYECINKRTEIMLEDGWLEETQEIGGTSWELFLKEKKLIGYPEILDYLDDSKEYLYSDLVDRIKQKTRNYAKRQITFGKMILRKLKTAQEEYKLQGKDSKSEYLTVSLTGSDQEKDIQQLSDKIVLLTKELVG